VIEGRPAAPSGWFQLLSDRWSNLGRGREACNRAQAAAGSAVGAAPTAAARPAASARRPAVCAQTAPQCRSSHAAGAARLISTSQSRVAASPPHPPTHPHPPPPTPVYEEMNANVIVVGDYKAYHKDNPSMPVNVDVLVGARELHAPLEVPFAAARSWRTAADEGG
jgi:hypothetical protein